MIIELFGKRNDGGTSFHSAVAYIASLRDQIDPETGEVIDRGMVTTFTNCHSLETAAIEMPLHVPTPSVKNAFVVPRRARQTQNKKE